jgi:phospholipid N-methyltransferase
MHISNNRIFFQSAAKDFKRTGAVAPSSKVLAQSMTSELSVRYRPATAVLEVGAGTGSITGQIVRHLRAGDRLDIYEIDARFASLLRYRLKHDESFGKLRAKVCVHNRPIEHIERRPRYDFVISCLPFTNFQPRAVREIFEIYRAVLKPGGVCSFYEYVLLRRAARLMSGNPAERARVAGVSRVVRETIARFGYKHDVVLLNLPPATVHHISFTR